MVERNTCLHFVDQPWWNEDGKGRNVNFEIFFRPSGDLCCLQTSVLCNLTSVADWSSDDPSTTLAVRQKGYQAFIAFRGAFTT